MEDSWKQWCWGVQKHQAVHSEQSLKSVKTVTAVKAWRSRSTQRKGIAIPCTSLCVLLQATWCHLANTPWVQENSRKPGTSLVVTRKGWMPSTHVQGEAFIHTSRYRAKELHFRRLWPLGKREHQMNVWKLFMPYENVLSSRSATHLLFQVPTQKEINSGSSSAQVYLILGRYIYLIVPKEKYHLGAIRNAKECFT